MPVVALVSGKSCGVTTAALSLGLSWPRRTVLVEADPAGGSITHGYLPQLAGAPGLAELAVAHRAGRLAEVIEDHLWPMDGGAGGRRLLPGIADPTQVASLAAVWEPLAALLRVLDEAAVDVIVDAGRAVVESVSRLSEARSPAVLLRRADVVLLAVRCTAASVLAARPVAQVLRADLAERGSGPDALGLLLVGEGPYRPAEVSRQLGGLPVLAALPWDAEAARILADGEAGRGLNARSRLLRQARSAEESVVAYARRRQVRLRLAGPGGAV